MTRMDVALLLCLLFVGGVAAWMYWRLACEVRRSMEARVQARILLSTLEWMKREYLYAVPCAPAFTRADAVVQQVDAALRKASRELDGPAEANTCAPEGEA